MEDHQHTPIGFYSDAFDKPLLVKCSECGDTLDVSVDLLEILHGPDIEQRVAHPIGGDDGTIALELITKAARKSVNQASR